MINLKKLIKTGAIALVFVYLATLGVLYSVQDNLIFPAPASDVDTLPDYASFAPMQTSDGETLRHIRIRGDEGAPKVMFFHGNGSLASRELERGRQLQENGFDVLLVEYRGYGASSGTPSSEKLLQDSLETYDWFTNGETDWVFLYGHSMGTGVASHVAGNRPVTSIALEAPFTRLSDVAASKHPVFPVRSLLNHEMDSVAALANTKSPVVPVMIIHGARDQVVPIEFGEALYQALDPETAKFERLDNANHNSLLANGSLDLVLGHFSKAF